jgi:CheY-like chemotaxis protein
MTFSTRNYFPEMEDLSDAAALLQGRYVMLQVSDTGEGMSQEIVKRAFEPFFSTKSTGKGAGLGLSMVYGMIKGLGGSIFLDSEVGHGTTVTVLLPAYVPDDDLEETENKKKSVPPITKKCLVVDDNDIVLFAQMRLLRKLGYAVISAQNGPDAVKIYEEQGNDISLVLLDLVMPIMDGAQTFKELKEIDPDVRVLLCTGYYHQKIISDLLEQGALGILKKPFALDQLSDELDRILD